MDAKSCRHRVFVASCETCQREQGVKAGLIPGPPRPLMVTTNDLPGYVVEQVSGEVFGILVQSRNIVSQVGSALKATVGGELVGVTKVLREAREEALNRLAQETVSRGGNAVLGLRIDLSPYSDTAVEVCAYGTSARVRTLPAPGTSS